MKTVIHFIHNLGSTWQVACMSGAPVTPHPVVMRTDDPRAVTCAACMKSNIFTDRMAAIRAAEAAKK